MRGAHRQEIVARPEEERARTRRMAFDVPATDSIALARDRRARYGLLLPALWPAPDSTATGRRPPRGSLIGELDRVDRAVFAAVAATPTPHLDAVMRGISEAANHSKLWIAASTIMALTGGPRGRRAAASGIISVAVTSAVANLISKRLLGRRPRPDREAAEVPPSRRVRVPGSGSFPSGHAASAVAFASGVARVVPGAGLPLRALAAVVAYSRVHTGVHYPGDVLAGAILGAAVADVTADAVTRRLSPC